MSSVGGASKESTARRFVLVRDEDVNGNSGVGVVAEGVEWSNGWVSLHWLSQLGCLNMYENLKVVLELHGHEGRTKIQWIDS
jgi:hypothetical protein